MRSDVPLQKKFVLTGGGTGGHVFPALSLAEEFVRRGYEVLYVGTERGLEAKYAPQAGIPFYSLKTGPLKNQSIIRRVRSLFDLLRGVLWSVKFLKTHKPQGVLGVGGYVSAPMSIAARLTGRPLFLQEQNVSVGIANRFLGKLAKKIFLGFPQARTAFQSDKCIVTGNPLRKEFFSAPIATYSAAPIRLLIFGGSQGAKAVNDGVLDALKELLALHPTISILHQTGKADFERVQSFYQQNCKAAFTVLPFIDNMVEAYQTASLVICRSGALTVSELIHVKRPALFVPFPRVGQNDQTANAAWMESLGVARVALQGENFSARFKTTLFECLPPATLTHMHQNYSRLHVGNASTTIIDHIEASCVRE